MQCTLKARSIVASVLSSAKDKIERPREDSEQTRVTTSSADANQGRNKRI